jgi:hypothetical protein
VVVGQVEDTVKKVVSGPSSAKTPLSLAQFNSVVNILQDQMDEAPDTEKFTIVPTPSSTSKAPSPLVMAVDDDSENDSEEEDFDEEDDMEVIYEYLKGERKALPVKEFMEWEKIQNLLSEALVTKEEVLEAVKAVVEGPPNEAQLTCDEFREIFLRIWIIPVLKTTGGGTKPAAG